MFERFTERARQVVVLAQEEARSLGHRYIGTEHILLGIVRENAGVAAGILADFHVNAEEIRNEILRLLSHPDRSRSTLTRARVPEGTTIVDAPTAGRPITFPMPEGPGELSTKIVIGKDEDYRVIVSWTPNDTTE